ncbi:MAG: VWA-like domain-containing protein [Oscillospiraceae bacterium]|nr:VWA-like domain-containing protein [Oscillospiraceae bacterium]
MSLARDILKLSRNTIIVNMRFIDAAIGMIDDMPYKGTIACDGKNFFFDPKFILQCFKRGREIPVRNYFHMLLHCIFRHYITGPDINEEAWGLACDIAAESIINEIDLPSMHRQDEEQKKIISEIQAKVNFLTAEKIYRYLLNNDISRITIAEWRKHFTADDHSIWFNHSSGGISSGDKDGNSDKTANSENNSASADSEESSDNQDNDSNAENDNKSGKSETDKQWEELAEKILTDLETMSKRQGDKSANFIQNLKAVTREKYDYSEFLKKFSVMGEKMKINDDEFDYIFYTYGMSILSSSGRKMPLIEPLEYKEIKSIREFVIAIDTSGSVHGELVQKFIQKTYNILKQTESFFTRINLHIIQCDAEIQEDVKITSQDEFDNYLKNMKLKGFGGTDFRPVFSYVDRLRNNHEFVNLKGLIYFTDGYGIFPERQPDYNTAFVFIDDNYNNPEVPVWAIKLILQSNEI